MSKGFRLTFIFLTIIKLLICENIFAGHMSAMAEAVKRSQNSDPYYGDQRSANDNDRLEDLLNNAITQGHLLSESVSKMVPPTKFLNLYRGFLNKYQLTSDLSLDRIEGIFSKHQLIQLRSFKTRKLVIGCGLNDGSHGSRCPHDRKYASSHEFDTWSVDPKYDPNIIGFWGDPKKCKILKKWKFDILIDEGPVISFIKDQDNYWNCIRMALKNEGIVLIPLHVLGKVKIPEDFKQIREDKTHQLSYHDSAVFKYVSSSTSSCTLL